MRMMMKVTIPVEAGDRGSKEGILPKTVTELGDRNKPKVYSFTPTGGKQTTFFFFDLADLTILPIAAKPFFENPNAEIVVSSAINLDQMRAGVEKEMEWS
jgi:hypothetical protein